MEIAKCIVLPTGNKPAARQLKMPWFLYFSKIVEKLSRADLKPFVLGQVITKAGVGPAATVSTADKVDVAWERGGCPVSCPLGHDSQLHPLLGSWVECVYVVRPALAIGTTHDEQSL